MSASSTRTLRQIKMVWWGCLIGVFLYSAVPFIMLTQPSGGNPDGSSAGSAMAVFLLAAAGSLLASSLPFTLLGRGYIRGRQGSGRGMLKSALLRLALAEVSVIVGVAVFVYTASFELFLPFPLVSVLGLLGLKREEKFYVDVLQITQE